MSFKSWCAEGSQLFPFLDNISVGKQKCSSISENVIHGIKQFHPCMRHNCGEWGSINVVCCLILVLHEFCVGLLKLSLQAQRFCVAFMKYFVGLIWDCSSHCSVQHLVSTENTIQNTTESIKWLKIYSSTGFPSLSLVGMLMCINQTLRKTLRLLDFVLKKIKRHWLAALFLIEACCIW